MIVDEKSLVSVAIAGAGTQGVNEAGALSSLLDAGMNVRDLAGTSAGAIISGIYALTKDKEVLKSLSISADYAKLLDFNWFNFLLNQNLNTGKDVRDWLGNITDHAKMGDCQIPLKLICGDLDTGGVQVWSNTTHPTMLLADAIYSSMALPFIFPPYLDRFVDGGTVRNIPLQFLDGPKKIGIAISNDFTVKRISTFVAKATRLLSMLLTDDDTILEALGTAYKIPVVKLPSLGYGFLDRNMTQSEKLELFNSGYNTMTDYLNSRSGKSWMSRKV